MKSVRAIAPSWKNRRVKRTCSAGFEIDGVDGSSILVGANGRI
jgi:hypothetical protein